LRDDGGVVYLSNVIEGPERIGVVHVYIWGKSAKGRAEDVRAETMALMSSEKLDRLICGIDVSNTLARRLAETVGFKAVGKVRQYKESGKRHDIILMDALLEDLNG
jgi:RimJ/RimL family protein N-acetyltransferase